MLKKGRGLGRKDDVVGFDDVVARSGLNAFL